MNALKEIFVDVLIIGFTWLTTTAGSMVIHGTKQCEGAVKTASCIKTNSHDPSGRATKSNM